jgi:hypothetical protein
MNTARYQEGVYKDTHPKVLLTLRTKGDIRPRDRKCGSSQGIEMG